MDALTLFLVFVKASILSVGGLSALPLLREDLIVSGAATEQQLVESLAIGRLSTGPSGLYVVSLGYFVLGPLGAAIATLAAILPPLTIVPAAALLRRQLLSAWFAGLVRGVALATSGLVVATGLQLIAPNTPLAAIPPWQLIVAALATALTAHGRIHPALILGGGALVGIVLATAHDLVRLH